MRPATRIAVVFAVVAAVNAPARADSLRCRGRIVSVGDARVDLLATCGEPTFRDRRIEARGGVAWDGDRGLGESRQVDVTVETWTYDFGPNRFVMTVTLENGRVSTIERGGYGRESGHEGEPAPPRVSTCDGRFREGDAKHDLLSRCGEPASRDVWEERRGGVERVGGSDQVVGGWSTVVHERWTYNFGPRRLVQHVSLENGRVTRVESGSYGYSE
ncbi:MAG TPA: DUF2845 domain-containing protein [Anaeromyxobacteraceae bacterium]|nr:DUF2845 domain-containing protein [Anaeromyxobacteraceae bacterium]